MTDDDGDEYDNLPANSLLLQALPEVAIGTRLDSKANAYGVIVAMFTGVNMTTAEPETVTVVIHSNVEVPFMESLYAAHMELHKRFDH